MFMERNYQQEKTKSLVRYCPLWDTYFCGNVDNGDGVWLECGMPERAGWSPNLQNVQNRGILPPQCLPALPGFQIWLQWSYRDSREVGGGRLFLIDALKACSGSQTRRHETKYNNWKKHPPPTLSQLPQAEGFYSSGATHTGPRIYKPFKSLEKYPHTFLLTPRHKMKIPKSKFNWMPTKYSIMSTP